MSLAVFLTKILISWPTLPKRPEEGSASGRARSRCSHHIITISLSPSLDSAFLTVNVTLDQGSLWGARDGHWNFLAYTSLAVFLGVLENPGLTHQPDSDHSPIDCGQEPCTLQTGHA